LVPLANSPLPYNVDGFSLADIAERTQVSGNLAPLPDDPGLPNYEVPVFATWLTMIADIVGIDPLYLAQPLIPILIVPAILVTFSLVRRLTKNDIASAFAALFLTFEGLYVFTTATVIKASIAFALIPIILWLYWEREDNRKRAIAAFLLVTLPLVHHLSSLVVFTMISFILFNDVLRWWRQGLLTLRRLVLEAALGPALFLPGLLYYDAVSLKYLLEVDDPRQIVLFFSVLFVFALVHRTLSLPAKSRRHARSTGTRKWGLVFDNKLLYPLGAVGLLLVNYRTSIFAGTIQTKPAFLDALVPYFILVLFCLIGFNLIRHFENSFRPLTMALIVAPLAIMSFAFVRGLDPISFMLMYRSYAYIALGVAMCAGCSMAFLIRILRRRELKAVVAVSFVVLLLLSLPLGYNSEEMYDVENATAPFEFEAMDHVKQLNATYVGSDQRISFVLGSYFHQDGDGYLPDRIAGDQALGGYDYALILDIWTGQGAQRYPRSNLVLDPVELASLREHNDVIYSIVSPIGGATVLHMR